MYSYKFREVELSNGKKRLLIDFENEKLDMLSVFLTTEVLTFSENILYCLDQVLEGRFDSEEFNGNACGLEITKERTLILDNLADDGMGDWCDIDTNELKKLIVMWLNKNQEYSENGII